MNDIDTETLKAIANQLRIHSIEETTAAASGIRPLAAPRRPRRGPVLSAICVIDPKNPHFYNERPLILSKAMPPAALRGLAESG
jgi:transketolase